MSGGQIVLELGALQMTLMIVYQSVKFLITMATVTDFNYVARGERANPAMRCTKPLSPPLLQYLQLGSG